jgi:hypothetical protein
LEALAAATRAASASMVVNAANVGCSRAARRSAASTSELLTAGSARELAVAVAVVVAAARAHCHSL